MKLYFTLLFTVFTKVCFSQSNYKPSYYVNLKGDTIRGYINYREWISNPETVEFKTSLTDTRKLSLTPADINSFAITGIETFVRYSGIISTDQTNVNRIQNGRDTSFRSEHIFLRILQKGKNVTLYKYEDYIKIRYFISTGIGLPVELTFRLYNNLQNQQTNTITENGFKRQLSIIASQYGLLNESLSADIQRADYSTNDLLRIISHINNYNGLNGTIAKSGNYLYAGAGVSITSFTVDGNYKAAGGKPYVSVLPKVLVGVNFYVNQYTQKLAFRFEAGIAANHYKSDYKELKSPYQNVIYRFTQINYSFSPQVLYNLYNKPDLKFYLAAGAQVNLNQYIDKVFKNEDGSPSLLAVAPFYLDNLNNSVLFKTGITVNKKLDIYISYLTGGIITQDPYFDLAQSSIQLGINLEIK